MTTNSSAPVDYAAGDEIIAKPAGYYRITRLIIVVACLGLAPWFAYDGWVNYPKENEAAKTLLVTEPPHNKLNVWLQKAIAVTLPVVGVVLLGWTFYNSRGRYVMRGDVVSIPGHPDTPLDAIRAIDISKWERKGIAYLEYELPTGEKGRSRLDDFIYERPPTDAIYDRIKKKLLPETVDPVQDESVAPRASDE